MKEWLEEHRAELEEDAIDAAFKSKGTELSYSEEELISTALGRLFARILDEVENAQS